MAVYNDSGIQYGTSLGATTSIGGATYAIESVNNSKAPPIAEAFDGEGSYVGCAFPTDYPEIQSITLFGASVPAVGSTFDGLVITEVSVNERNTDFVRCTVTARTIGPGI